MKHDPKLLDLYLAHRGALIDYAAPIVGCRVRAEDVVQEAYLRFSDTAGTPIAQPVGYLYRIVRNLALDWARRLTHEPRPHGGDTAVEAVPAAQASPEQQVLDRDALRIVAAALAELPERTRRAFELYRLGGQTLQQVAASLGISVGLTHQLVRDALNHCAARLDGA